MTDYTRFTKLDDLFSDLKSEVSGLMQENCSLKRKLEKLQGEKDRVENKKWQPKPNDAYWYIGDDGEIFTDIGADISTDWRLSQGNVFATEEQAEQYLENLKTKAELRKLADELNGDRVIDWENSHQDKYYLIYYPMTEHIEGALADDISCGNIYCIDSDFMEKAIERIGEQRLMDMIKAGV
jgi:hypothetical protein